MISEIANSLFLTYLASEYLVSSSAHPPPSSSSSSSRRSRSRSVYRDDKDNGEADATKSSNTDSNYAVTGFLAFLVGVANLVDHHYYLSLVWESFPKYLPHIPGIPSYYLVIFAKLFAAAASYALALYIDIHRDRRKNNTSHKPTKPRMPFRKVFLPKVGWAFLKILPAYPFLAVLISFVFLFVVDVWDYVFHLPLEWLNNPIYYGTLYGPFAYTYVHVKKEVLRKNYHSDASYYYGESSSSSTNNSTYSNAFDHGTRTDAFV